MSETQQAGLSRRGAITPDAWALAARKAFGMYNWNKRETVAINDFILTCDDAAAEALTNTLAPVVTDNDVKDVAWKAYRDGYIEGSRRLVPSLSEATTEAESNASGYVDARWPGEKTPEAHQR